jgi:hypothetical protein
MSNYCTLDDAFQEIGGSPSPGCNTDYSTKASRKEERRKARRAKGPAATYFDIPSVDPDREQYKRADEVSAMNRDNKEQFSNNFTHHITTDEEQQQIDDKQSVPNFDKDPMSKYMQDQIRNKYTVMPMPTDKLSQPFTAKKSFFGADPDTDNYANYMPDQEDYKLQPDFMTAFEHAGVARAGSMARVPDPNKNMYWKPETTSGAQSSFIEHLPPNRSSRGSSKGNNSNDEYSPQEIMKRMDKIFAKLDDMNRVSPEQVTSELLMFISSGIFVVFMMDLLVRKGSKMRF